MITFCKNCTLFPVESQTINRKINPSNTHCRDCVRIKLREEKEELIEEAREMQKKTTLSTSLLQRKFKITYEKAKEILEKVQQQEEYV